MTHGQKIDTDILSMSGDGAQEGKAVHFKRGLALEAIVGVCDVVEGLQPGKEAVELAAAVERVSCQLTHHQPVEEGEGGRVQSGQFIGRQVQAAEVGALPEGIGGNDLDEVVL